MPRNERRNAHRYAPARDKVRLGWWEGQQFRTISARLKCLSMSGSLVQLEVGANAPAGVQAWICLVDQSPAQWVQTETVEGCPERVETPGVLRLKFIDTFPNESFKKAVWDDEFTGGRAGCSAGSSSPPSSDEESAQATSSVIVSGSERLGFSWQLDEPTSATAGCEPDNSGPASPHPPTLIDAYRRQMATSRKVASLPWLLMFLVGLFISMMLGLLAKGQMVGLRRLVMMLGQNEPH